MSPLTARSRMAQKKQQSIPEIGLFIHTHMLMSLQKSILHSVQSDDVLLELPPVACVVLVLQFCWCKCVYYAISSQNHNHHRRNRRG